MKNTALLLAVLIILSGFGWYLFKSVPVAEAPVMVGGNPTGPSLPQANDNQFETVDSFAACVAAGNPVMESYPRRCRHAGQLFVEPLDPQYEPAPSDPDDQTDEPGACTMDAKICPDGTAVGRTGPNCEFAPCPGNGADDPVISCPPRSQDAEVCTAQYDPVCALVEVQCITTPCDPIPETFSNSCAACSQPNVSSYREGACTDR